MSKLLRHQVPSGGSIRVIAPDDYYFGPLIETAQTRSNLSTRRIFDNAKRNCRSAIALLVRLRPLGIRAISSGSWAGLTTRAPEGESLLRAFDSLRDWVPEAGTPASGKGTGLSLDEQPTSSFHWLAKLDQVTTCHILRPMAWRGPQFRGLQSATTDNVGLVRQTAPFNGWHFKGLRAGVHPMRDYERAGRASNAGSSPQKTRCRSHSTAFTT